ncbi:MAG: T9SS type A sorting domain-containing protein [Bacteroidota bacterium]|nr:T9SS type A sorting domain-containing protein [Bacteroidota bacterium]MDP4232581.1 T9SS type A sorting domain-containing protein [Bacteroidota bacterium]MDP4242965.1 T9SS type A sorting domain-containing protein [Bacteroidota bacterium]MDP4286460.1 T9SS type A sorting domain-containing protein [Bacteroidota bacterium]
MTKLLRIFIVAGLILPLSSRAILAQWVASNLHWGGGVYAHIASNGTNVYFTDIGSMFYSSNDGITWINISSGLGTNGIGPILADESHLFAVAGDSGFVFRSSDNGTTWDSVSSGLPANAIAINLNTGALVGAATNLYAGGAGIFYSSNFGASWVKRSDGLPSDALIKALVVSGSNVYAATSSYGVFRSTDSGLSWTTVNKGLPSNYYNISLPAQVISLTTLGTCLFAGTIGHDGDTSYGVYRSTDSGTTWYHSDNGLGLHNIGTGLLECDSAVEFAVTGTRIFAVLDAGGVYCSADSGQTWSNYNQWDWGPYGEPLTRAITVTNQTAFVVTYLRGLWQRPLSDFKAGVTPVTSAAAVEISPNPTDGLVSIHAGKVVHLVVENLLGESVLEQAATRSTDFTLDLSQQPAGVYYLRITLGTGEVRTIKLVKE